MLITMLYSGCLHTNNFSESFVHMDSKHPFLWPAVLGQNCAYYSWYFTAFSTRSVCWYSSVFTRWHQSTLRWWSTRFLPPLAEVISVPQHAAIWQYLDPERRPTDKEVFPSLVRHCGTHYRSLFVTNLWQWCSSAHIWRLFCFAEHIVLSIAPSCLGCK